MLLNNLLIVKSISHIGLFSYANST